MNLPDAVLVIARREGIDPLAALYRFEKSKHSPARYETSKRHPIVNGRVLKCLDAWNRHRNWNDREYDDE